MKLVVYSFNEAQVGPAAVANTHLSIVYLQLPTSPLEAETSCFIPNEGPVHGGSVPSSLFRGSVLHGRPMLAHAHVCCRCSPSPGTLHQRTPMAMLTHMPSWFSRTKSHQPRCAH